MNKTLAAIILSSASFVGCNSNIPQKSPSIAEPTRRVIFIPTVIKAASCERQSDCNIIVSIKDVSYETGDSHAPAPCTYRSIQSTSLDQTRAIFDREVRQLEQQLKTGSYFSTQVNTYDPKTQVYIGDGVIRGKNGCYEAMVPLSMWPSIATTAGK